MDYTVEDLFNLVQEILETIQNRKQPIKITPELLEDIEKLKKIVTKLKENIDDNIKFLGVDTQNVNEEMLNSSQKQLILRAKDLEKKALAIKLALDSRPKNDLKDIENQVVDKNQKKQRRKLFKTIGGDKKWIPL